MKQFLLLILLIQSASAAQTGNASPEGLTIRFPGNIEPETAIIEFEISGKGALLSSIVTRKGIHDYSLPGTGALVREVGEVKSLKVLIYVPGYQMVTESFNAAELKTGLVFVPPLVPLHTVRLSGTLIDSAQNPLPGETLGVQYVLDEAMSYFGYIDGGVPAITVAREKTHSDGGFNLDLPAVLEDPFFKLYNARNGNFGLFISEPVSAGGYTLTPNSFAPRENYARILIMKTGMGTLSGKLGQSFLKANKLPGNLKPYVRHGDTFVSGIQLEAQSAGKGAWFNTSLKGDGTFEVHLPVGIYDLVLRGAMSDTPIVIERSVLIEENKQRIVERP